VSMLISSPCCWHAIGVGSDRSRHRPGPERQRTEAPSRQSCTTPMTHKGQREAHRGAPLPPGGWRTGASCRRGRVLLRQQQERPQRFAAVGAPLRCIPGDATPERYERVLAQGKYDGPCVAFRRSATVTVVARTEVESWSYGLNGSGSVGGWVPAPAGDHGRTSLRRWAAGWAEWYGTTATVALWGLLDPRRQVTAYRIQQLRDSRQLLPLSGRRPARLVGGGPRNPQEFREDMGVLLELLAADKIHPVVAERLPLSEARRAHELLESCAAKGKIVLVP